MKTARQIKSKSHTNTQPTAQTTTPSINWRQAVADKQRQTAEASAQARTLWNALFAPKGGSQ